MVERADELPSAAPMDRQPSTEASRQRKHKRSAGGLPVPVEVQVHGWNGGASLADSLVLYYGRFLLQELIDSLDPPPLIRRLLLGCVWFWDQLLRRLGIDAHVIVDAHQLMRGHYHFSEAELQASIEILRARYPGHALIFTDVHDAVPGGLSHILQRCGFRLIGHSVCYVVPANVRASWNFNRNLHRDLKLLARTPVSFVRAPVDDLAVAERLVSHYDAVYRVRHSELHPRRDAAFFLSPPPGTQLTILRSPQDEVLGFFAIGQDADFLYAQLIGFQPSAHNDHQGDSGQPHSRELYRLGVAATIRQARELGLHCWLGAGKRRFKLSRGAQPTPIYLAVYHAHLPVWRRIGWWLCALEGWLIHRIEPYVST